MYESKALYHKGKKGELRVWRVWTEGADIITEYGQEGGALQTSRKEALPKNVGRSNVTTAEQQADLEAKALYTFKLDRKYSVTPEKAREELLLPMLAKRLDKRKKPIPYPVDVQPKLDGVRCLAVPEQTPAGVKVRLLSRSGKPYDIPHISEALEKFQNVSTILDGEIYTHNVPFQELCKWIKKARPETLNLEYHVYDVPRYGGIEGETWGGRAMDLAFVGQTVQALPGDSPIKILEADRAHNLEEVLALEKNYIKAGYEGAIVRLPEGIYRWGYRSPDLLKVKTFEDAEFSVTGCRHGKGKFKECAIFECQTEDGQTFSVAPKGTIPERMGYYARRAFYVGKRLKVQFFHRTEDGIPRFPVGLGFRLEEDM